MQNGLSVRPGLWTGVNFHKLKTAQQAVIQLKRSTPKLPNVELETNIGTPQRGQEQTPSTASSSRLVASAPVRRDFKKFEISFPLLVNQQHVNAAIPGPAVLCFVARHGFCLSISLSRYAGRFDISNFFQELCNVIGPLLGKPQV